MTRKSDSSQTAWRKSSNVANASNQTPPREVSIRPIAWRHGPYRQHGFVRTIWSEVQLPSKDFATREELEAAWEQISIYLDEETWDEAVFAPSIKAHPSKVPMSCAVPEVLQTQSTAGSIAATGATSDLPSLVSAQVATFQSKLGTHTGALPIKIGGDSSVPRHTKEWQDVTRLWCVSGLWVNEGKESVCTDITSRTRPPRWKDGGLIFEDISSADVIHDSKVSVSA